MLNVLVAPGHSNRYAFVNSTNARFGIEWDFDGNTDYEGNPYYVFCDTGGGRSQFSIRTRFDSFGIGVGMDRSGGIEIGCDALQVLWDLRIMGVCGITACLPFPWFKVNGGLSVSIQAPFPVAEVLYAGKWWSIPNKLVVSD